MASVAGPRREGIFNTQTSVIESPRWILNALPIDTSRAALARSPSTRTLPLRTAFAARLRVLKNLAYHNQRSTRIRLTHGVAAPTHAYDR